MAAQPSMTIDDFKKRLKEDYYSDLGGARKGIGRVQGWSDRLKDEARAIAEKHFGAAGKEAAPKKANGKKEKPAKKEKTTRAKAAKATTETASASATETVTAAATEKRVANVNTIIASVNNNLSVLAVAKGLGADPSEVAQTATKCQKTLDLAIDNLMGTLRKITPQLQGTPDPVVTQSFGAAVAAANGIPQAAQIPLPASHPIG